MYSVGSLPCALSSDRCVPCGARLTFVVAVKEGDKISMPASILSELMRKQAEIPWQFQLKLVRRKGPGKFEPVDVAAPPKEVNWLGHYRCAVYARLAAWFCLT